MTSAANCIQWKHTIDNINPQQFTISINYAVNPFGLAAFLLAGCISCRRINVLCSCAQSAYSICVKVTKQAVAYDFRKRTWHSMSSCQYQIRPRWWFTLSKHNEHWPIVTDGLYDHAAKIPLIMCGSWLHWKIDSAADSCGQLQKIARIVYQAYTMTNWNAARLFQMK